MTSLPAALALALLPGLLVLRGPVWLALPASLAFWLASWSLCGLGMERSGLLNGGLAASVGLLLVGLPRMERPRWILAAVVALALVAPLAVDPGLPWSDKVAGEAAGARLLAWHDGVPRVEVPFGDGPFRWPGGLAPLLADLLLVSRAGIPAAIWSVAIVPVLAFALVAAWPREGAARPVRIGGAVVVAVLLAALDPGWLVAVTLALAALRLRREHAGAPASFGAAVLLAGAAAVDPVIAAAGVVALVVRERRQAVAAVLGALLLVLPLGVPRAPRWVAGHGRGPDRAERAALDRIARESAPLDSVCGPPARAAWVPALAGRRVASCPGGLTSFHTVRSNPRAANP